MCNEDADMLLRLLLVGVFLTSTAQSQSQNATVVFPRAAVLFEAPDDGVSWDSCHLNFMRFASADVTSIKLDDESVTVYSPPQQQLDLKLRHAVGALSRDGMEHELLLAAAEHPSVAARLLATQTTTPVSVRSISHQRVALDGDATSSAVGRKVTISGSGFIVGAHTAKCNVSSIDTFEGFNRGFSSDHPHRIIQVPAQVLSPSIMQCVLPEVPTGGPAKVAVSMDSGTTFGINAAIEFEYFALVSFAIGRRPYTFETTGKLIVGIAPELLQHAHGAAIQTTAIVQGSAAGGAAEFPLQLEQPSQLSAPDNTVHFPLSGLPPSIDAVLQLSVQLHSVGGGGSLVVNKTRRFVRVPLAPAQEAVVVDHATRSMALIKPGGVNREAKPWMGTGWYIMSGFECHGGEAPNLDWPTGNSPGNFSGIVDTLARRGFNQLMVYDALTVMCGPTGTEASIENIQRFLLPLMVRCSFRGQRLFSFLS